MVIDTPSASALAPTEDAFVHIALPKDSAALEQTADRRRSWARHALFSAVSVGALGAFLATSRALHSPRARQFDRAIMRRIAALRTPRRNEIMRDLTSLGGVTVASLTAATSLVLARRSPTAMLQIALGGLGGVIAEIGIKHYFARPRPEIVDRLQLVTSWSYPSGHSIASSCLFLTLAFVGSHRLQERGSRLALLTAAGALAGIVGSSRVYLGVHYPTDVAGGLALGTAWACLLDAAFDFAGARALDERRRGLSSATAEPQPAGQALAP